MTRDQTGRLRLVYAQDADLLALLAEWEERGRALEGMASALNAIREEVEDLKRDNQRRYDILQTMGEEDAGECERLVLAAEARAAEWEKEAADRTKEYVGVIEGLQAKLARVVEAGDNLQREARVVAVPGTGHLIDAIEMWTSAVLAAARGE